MKLTLTGDGSNGGNRRFRDHHGGEQKLVAIQPENSPDSPNRRVCSLCNRLGIGIWAKRTLGKQLAVAATKTRTITLVTNGPYALVRHPMYAGGHLVTVGFGLVTRSLPVFLGSLLISLMLHKIALKEEKELLKLGIGYTAYRRSVRHRYLPLSGFDKWQFWQA